MESKRAEISQRYDDYLEEIKPNKPHFSVYLSHLGGQALVYSLLQEILPVNNSLKLLLFRIITIMLSALVLSLFLTWLYRNYSLIVASVTFILLCFVPIIILLSYNLWWAFWSYYIPFIGLTLILEYRKNKQRILFDNKLLLYLVLLCFLKFFFAGFEFITSALVMAICPIVYYLMLEKYSLNKGIVYLCKSCVAAIFGVFLGVLYLVLQARFYKGSWNTAIEHIVDAFFRRSIYSADLDDSSLLGVINSFGLMDVFRSNYLNITVNYAVLIVVVTLLCIVLYYFRNKIWKAYLRENTALLFITITALLGPLSWYVMFTQHALNHSLDIVVMYMPYCLYGFAVIGLGVDAVVRFIRDKYM